MLEYGFAKVTISQSPFEGLQTVQLEETEGIPWESSRDVVATRAGKSRINLLNSNQLLLSFPSLVLSSIARRGTRWTQSGLSLRVGAAVLWCCQALTSVHSFWNVSRRVQFLD